MRLGELPARFTAIAMLAVLLLGGCDRGISQATPEATIASARRLVEARRADQLNRLIYPESPEMTEFLRKLGVLMGNLQKLAVQIEKSFPDKVAELKAKAEEAAKSGAASDLIGQLAPNRSRRRGPVDVKEEEKRQQALEGVLTRLFADPYSFLRDSEKRLTTKYQTDDSVSLLWDEEPILKPIGLTMKQGEDGLWYFKLPTAIPFLSNYLPRSKKEWKIAEYAVVVLNNTLVDLRKDIEAKRITSIDQLTQSAGEKTIPPMILIFAAYSKALEDRKAPAPK